jgi:transposase InsO family protein
VIASHNRTQSSLHATVGRPGDGICPRYSRTRFCRFWVSTQHLHYQVLRRPVEYGHFTLWAFTNKIRASGLMPSFGTVGDCYDNSMME